MIRNRAGNIFVIHAGKQLRSLLQPPHLSQRHRLKLPAIQRIHTVELFEIRQHLLDPSRKIEISIAKATYVKTQGIWKLYWQRANMKWYRYDHSGIKTLEEVFSIVKADEYGAFFG